MRTEEFDYHLPPDLIAQTPRPRGESKLLVLERESGRITHAQFQDLPDFLTPDDTLVLNDTRVNARRLQALRESGGSAEVLLIRSVGDTECDALVRPGIKPGACLKIKLSDGQYTSAKVIAITEDGGRRIRLASTPERDCLFLTGDVPLPPYIQEKLYDEERYQTVYAQRSGSAAAPTAGLHFTNSMIVCLASNGIRLARVTLHVGVDTFRPVKTDRIEDHKMHGEHFEITTANADIINSTQGRVIAVGTTSVRALESAATEFRRVAPVSTDTRLFITPGFRFNVVDALLTNFHLPKTTLLMLVSAFAGTENVLSAYREAVRENYRFFSFGDAMLVI